MKRFVLPTAITVLIWSMIAPSIVIADYAEREQLKRECMENLHKIGKAVEDYRADHDDEMPDWLSDLYPKYLQDPNILLCPADETKGFPALFTVFKDPKMPCSYLYQFNPMKVTSSVLFERNPPKNLTYKEAKRMQLNYFGNLLPVIRCRHHGRQVLNLCYDGNVSFLPRNWESAPEAIKEVLSFFQRAVEQNPNGWEREFSLPEMYRYFERLGRLPDLRVLLEKQSNLSVDALRILAEIYQSEGKIGKAIEIYQRLMSFVPNDTASRLQLAELYATQKNYQAARDQLNQIIRLEPDNPKVYGLLTELDAIDDALRIQQEFSELPGEEPKIHYLLKLEELLLSSPKNLKPAVRKARTILRESFGEAMSVKRLESLYQALDKSFASRPGQWKTYTSSDGLINDSVYAMAQDNRGILWIGTRRGVCQYDGESFTDFTINEELRGATIFSLLIDKQDNIWFGTRSHGVVRYDGRNFVNYTIENGLAGNSVSEIYQDRNGFIWFACGSSGGISRYDGKNFTTFTTDDGLAHNQVWTMMEDSRGVIWIGTRGGVSQEEGLTRYTSNPIPPLIHLESIVADRVYTNPKTISLPAGIGNLRINYRGISFRTRPEAMKYIYQLRGHDNDWQEPTNERSVDYLDLAPNTYTFKVKAVDRDLHYSESASVTFKVMPPWYFNGWIAIPAGGAILALLIGFIFFGSRYYIQRHESQNLREQMLQQERNVRETLEAQNVQLKEAKEALESSLEREERSGNTLRSLAHTVKNPLSKIEGIIDIVFFEPSIVEPDSMCNLLDGIKSEVNQARQTVNRLLEATAPPQFHQFDFQAELELLLQQTLQVNPIWEDKIKLNKQIETIPQIKGDSKKLSLAFENLFINACEAMEEGGGILTLKLIEKKNSIQIQVQDTGVGIGKENLPNLFKPLYTTKKAKGGTGLGLWITKQIIDDHKGEIRVDSEVGVGTTVYVDLPISQDV